METSLAEDVQKHTQTLSRTASSLCRRTAVLAPPAASAASHSPLSAAMR